MALDAGMIAAIAKELNEKLAGARVEKIHQPEKDEIDLYFRSSGKSERLALVTSPGSPRAGLSTEARENPAVPPAFCTLLRKHLGGAVLKGVSTPGFERALIFDFSARDEMGYETEAKIVAELMGKYGNVILLGREDKILGVLRPVDFSVSEKRQLLPGMRYEEPPRQEGRKDPLFEEREDFLKAARAAADRPADKFILSSYAGVSPLVAREIAFEATGRTDSPAAENAERLYRAFSSFVRRVKNCDFEPCVVEKEGEKIEYSFMPIRQYGPGYTLVSYESPSLMLESFQSEKERELHVRRRAQDLYKKLSSAEARLLRKIDAQKKELEECAEKDRCKQYADLITANLYSLEKGQKEARLVNYYSPEMETVVLPLDSRLSPAQNAQKYYRRYGKLKTAEKELARQIACAEEELYYVRSVTDALNRTALPAEIEEIRRELQRTGYLGKSRVPPSKKAPPPKYLVYRTSGGFTVLCGRNNLQNDALTFENAGKNDWWFHVHAAPGSHAVLLAEGVDDPPAEDFTQACMIAAVNSGFAGANAVTVDYTRVRNVKKPPHAKPGYVIYHTNYSAVVNADINAVKALERS